jgi:hypothetical protein
MKRLFMIAGLLLLVLSTSIPVIGQPLQQDGGGYLYLPIVMNKSYRELINGDFESGHTGWSEVSTQGGVPLIYEDTQGDVPFAHSGSWYAWLGGVKATTDYIEQTVTVQADKPVLNFYYQIFSVDVNCILDNAQVRVNNNVVFETNLCSGVSAWVLESVSLASYTGQSITLQFRAVTAADIPGNWYLDDISFVAP